MITVAIDSSNKAGGVAILEGEKLIYETYINLGLTHSETLLPIIQMAMQITGITPAKVGLYAVAAGPGSFTGLRIGMAAVKGIAMVNNTPCIAVSSLESMARSVYIPEESVIISATDARRGEVYYAVYKNTKEGLLSICEETSGHPEGISKTLKSNKSLIFIIGDGAQICYNELAKDFAVTVLPESQLQGRAIGVAKAALNEYKLNGAVTAEQLEPSYLRLSQAQRERQEKLKGNEI